MRAPDHKMYHEKSQRLMEYLRSFTEEIEQVSVDECYMDFTEIADRFPSPQAELNGSGRCEEEVWFYGEYWYFRE